MVLDERDISRWRNAQEIGLSCFVGDLMADASWGVFFATDVVRLLANLNGHSRLRSLDVEFK